MFFAACPNEFISYIGDGICDDKVNIESCWFDQGDCCDSNYIVSHSKCTECYCYADISKIFQNTGDECTLSLSNPWNSIGDGECNEEFNNLEGLFDAGDCCYDPIAKKSKLPFLHSY